MPQNPENGRSGVISQKMLHGIYLLILKKSDIGFFIQKIRVP
jgi:hypothetical protein